MTIGTISEKEILGLYSPSGLRQTPSEKTTFAQVFSSWRSSGRCGTRRRIPAARTPSLTSRKVSWLWAREDCLGQVLHTHLEEARVLPLQLHPAGRPHQYTGTVSRNEALYSVLCTLYSVLCTLYSIICTLYSVLCTLYSVFCTLYCALFTSSSLTDPV